jgi:hypothetical protein
LRHLGRSLALSGLVVSSLLGCEERPPPRPKSPPAELAVDEHAPVYLPELAADAEAPEFPIRPAVVVDEQYDSSELVVAQRFVYRHRLRIPPGLGPGVPGYAQVPKELRVDVTPDRLRVTFLGPDWPVPDGSEVRMRADRAGAYVFDGQGGRSLGTAQLAAWYEGSATAPSPGLGLRIEEAPELSPYMPLFCRFLAEWGRAPLEAIQRRCESGSPKVFRIGHGPSERTAHVPMRLPKRRLRADHFDPPPASLASPRARVLLDRATLARVRPKIRGEYVQPEDTDERPALRIENAAAGRSIIVLEGTQVAILEEGATVTLEGLAPGTYRLGVLRPFGHRRQVPSLVSVPGELKID